MAFRFSKYSLFQWLVKIKSHKLLVVLWLINTRPLTFLGKDAVLILNRPIFSEDMSEVIRESEGLSYLRINKAALQSVFSAMCPELAKIHKDYYKFAQIYASQRMKYFEVCSLYIFLLKKIFKLKAVISANLNYSWQYEIASVCDTLDLKFIVLHKEGVVHSSEAARLIKKFTPQDHLISKTLVYSKYIKSALLDLNAGFTDQSVAVVGVPRFDAYRCSSADRSVTRESKDITITIFTFFVEDKVRHLDLESEHVSEIKYKADNFLVSLIRYAGLNKKIKLNIKVKQNEKYYARVKTIMRTLRENDSNNFEHNNIEILRFDKVSELVRKSDIVVGHANSALLEGLIAEKVVISPEIYGNQYNDVLLDLPNYFVTSHINDIDSIIKRYDLINTRLTGAHVDRINEFIQYERHVRSAKLAADTILNEVNS
jgi:hypothetical protein